ncbi:MAG: WbqC family protein [Nitrososphaeraceae archaeon]
MIKKKKIKIGIMQPYFLPYLGYFSLIKHTDEFILLDTVKFIRHGWIERNRILKQGEGWIYIKVPLAKHHSSTLIKDIEIDNNIDWKSKILAQMEIYKKTSRYYCVVLKLVAEVLEQKYTDIVTLNKTFMEAVCNYLKFKRPIEIFSEMGLKIEKPKEPDEWALNICRVLEAVDEYWNPLGGQAFYDKTKYEKAGLKLKFQSIILKEYDQRRKAFELGLSIIDVMMFNSPEEINEMLDNYELI